MTFTNSNDTGRCMDIVRKELEKRGINVNDQILNRITEDIMKISYSTGGNYSDKIIQSYAETYIEEKLFEKFIYL